MTARRRRAGSQPATGSVRRSGRHPAAERTVVRLTDAAVADLQVMIRNGDPQVVRWALKKCLMLERDPEAGEGLRGSLIGYRKLKVSDRDWRIIWRVGHDDTGRPVVDVAEVWALGARGDDEVYAEMRERVATLSKDPATLPLAEVIDRLGRVAAGLVTTSAGPLPASEMSALSALPDWLTQALIRVVGLPVAEVNHLTLDEAMRRWETYTNSSR